MNTFNKKASLIYYELYNIQYIIYSSFYVGYTSLFKIV